MEKKILVNEKDYQELLNFKNNTIWRLQKEDFDISFENRNISKEKKEEIIDKAFDRFNIPDWSEYVDIFIENSV